MMVCTRVIGYRCEFESRSSLSVVFSGYSVSPTNKTDCHYITEILLKVALNTITLTLILLVIVFVFTFNISVMITRLIERSGQL